MATPHHLHFINPIPRHGPTDLFHLFPMLTLELRLIIWEFAVQQNRLLIATVEPLTTAATPAYSTTNAHGNIASGSFFTVTLHNRQFHSKLLWVNREARRVARRFYRVQIPCHLRRVSEVEYSYGRTFRRKSFSIFYFSPEHDILRVEARHIEHTIVPFLHDLRAYDPKGVGLLSLAIDSQLISDIWHFMPEFEELGQASFVDSLSRLRQIIWWASSPAGRACMWGFTNLWTVGFRFIHSMPIMSNNSVFDVPVADPRTVQPELQYVVTCTHDPREWSLMWRDIAAKWCIAQSPPARQEVLFAYSGMCGPGVQDAETARRYLVREENSWLAGQKERSSMVLKVAGRVPVEGSEELAKAVRPAFGFWLFPIGALKDPVRARLNLYNWPVFDLRGHEPDLALSHLY